MPNFAQEDGEEGFADIRCKAAYPVCDAVSQRGLLDPLKPAFYNQRRTNGRLS